MLAQFQIGSVDKLIDEVQSSLDNLEEPTPSFRFFIGWSHNYESLFEDNFAQKTEVNVVLKKAEESGRVLLCGKGGGGKTVVMHRLARLALKERVIPVLLDLKRWTAGHYSYWTGCLTSHSDRAEFLLRRFSVPEMTSVRLDALPPNTKKVLFVDGLNEVSSGTGNQIIEALDEYVSYALQTSIVVTDRLTRRRFNNVSRWQLGTVLPLDESDVGYYLGRAPDGTGLDSAARSVLTSPFFLDAALKYGHSASSSALMHHEYLMHHASLSEDELAKAALAAYKAYVVAGARTFPFEGFEALAGKVVTEKLLTAQVLIKDGDQAFFDHHLRHDYLVSWFLAKEGEPAWVPEVFNTVTLLASSFDVLRLTLEQLPNSAQADRFVRRVYDWNIYGVAYSVTEASPQRSSKVSAEMEVFLLAMLAERKWDIVTATSQRAFDALRLFPSPEARQFLRAPNLDAVFQLVGNVPTAQEWFSEWRSIFTRQPETETTDEELELVRDEDSIKGWTYANVLKRLKLSDIQQRLLESFLADANSTVRWRIAHVLGAFPSFANTEVLLRLFDRDPDRWVRYGTIRSLVEAAALGEPEIRESILGDIRERIAKLSADEICLDQFQSAIFIDPKRAPRDWGKAVVKIINALLGNATSIEEIEDFQRVAYNLKDHYGV